MQELRYTVGRDICYVSREAILKAMEYFDRKCRKTRPAKGRKYFVWWRGKPYPPKDVLRCMSKGPAGVFSGGETTNQIFRDLGFHVGKGSFPKRLPGTDKPLPSIRTLKKQLFGKRWSRFERDFLRRDKEEQFPGVYLLAYSDQPMADKPVKPDDIFYVGSSCTGLNARLNQFHDGIRRYCCHSAAMRFYKRWRRRSRPRPRQLFYVAVVAVPCETRKELRTEKDIRKMGRVAELEYAALAHIKKHTGFEPLLNKK